MKFLVGYNGSVEAKAALSLARDFAKTFNARIFVMSSMEGGAGEKVEDINQAEQNLREAKAFFDDQGVECETHQMARGLTPGEDLVRFAEENQIDQIFVGIEKKSRTSKLILGSTAQFVILKAPCPVITTK
ncbi:MAG: universal stress protein [Deltaproteobacteria bacterium]|nr:universal stress protein [Deltaproteobacteria bacterium]